MASASEDKHYSDDLQTCVCVSVCVCVCVCVFMCGTYMAMVWW